jgi:aspartate aminotransferase-like enzyme
VGLRAWLAGVMVGSSITHVMVAQCETSIGILNPIKPIAAICRRADMFRFTQAIQLLLAFAGAPRERAEEGGIEGRHARYHRSGLRLPDGMRHAGFRTLLEDEVSPPSSVPLTNRWTPRAPNRHCPSPAHFESSLCGNANRKRVVARDLPGFRAGAAR